MLHPCLTPFQQKKPKNKWTQIEIQNLLKIVKLLEPENTSEWRNVCMKMHETGSRRKPWDYKAKFTSYKDKLRELQLKNNGQNHNQNITQIIRLYQNGKTSDQISQELANVSISCVRRVIASKLSTINKVIAKLVKKNQFKQLKSTDYVLYSFLKEQKLQIDSLDQIQVHCLSLKVLKQQKDTFQKQNSIKYYQIKEDLERKLIQFHKKITNYRILYQSYLKNKPQTMNKVSKILNNNKLHSDKSPTVPFRHLSVIAEQTGQIQQANQGENYFSQQVYQQLKLCHQKTMNTLPGGQGQDQQCSQPQFQFHNEARNQQQENNISSEHQSQGSQMFLPKLKQNYQLSLQDNCYLPYNQNFDSYEYFC